MEHGCLNKNSLGGDVKGFAVIGGDVMGGRSGFGGEVTGGLVTLKKHNQKQIVAKDCEIMTFLTVGS